MASQNVSVDMLKRQQRYYKRHLASLEREAADQSLTLSELRVLLNSVVEVRDNSRPVQYEIFERMKDDVAACEREETSDDDFMNRCDVLIRSVGARTLNVQEELQQPMHRENNSDELYRAMSRQADILQSLADIQRNSATPGSNRLSAAKVKLPQIELPKFSGKYSDWPSFFDTFKSIIHENDDVPVLQKCWYLKRQLEGSAAEDVKHVMITEENYPSLWSHLQSRYGKKVHIINEYIDKFLNQPKMTDGSLKTLKSIAQNYSGIISELKNLGPEYFTIDSWLIYLMKQKMDKETKKAWEEKRDSSDIATLKEWFEFLTSRVDAMERWVDTTSDIAAASSSAKNPPKPREKGPVKTHHTEPAHCQKCNQAGHLLFQCDEFKALPCGDRRTFVAESKVCYNCLRPNHSARNCTSTSRCRTCNKYHHSLLHPEDPPAAKPEAVTTHHSAITKRALLPTALVNVTDRDNNLQVCRILIDSGSECSLISESCAQRLRLSRKNARIAVNGTAAVTVGFTRGLVSLKLTSICDPDESIQVDALVLSKLTTKLPTTQLVQSKDWEHLRDLPLADPHFDKPAEVDIILSAEHALDINRPNIIRGDGGAPVAQETIFGWVVGGKVGVNPSVVTTFHTTWNMDESLRSFWQESDAISETELDEEKFCEDHFTENVRRDESGRYEVRLPVKKSPELLGDSRPAALSRLRVMERKFTRNPEFHQMYVDFMREYEARDHMELVPAAQAEDESKPTYVIPHMAVMRPSSTTTKLRVVFDASCSTRPMNVSLNSILAAGPTIQDDVLSLLLRFRTYQVAFTSDVEKMYRQIRVAPEDRHLQRIFWRESTNQPIQMYQLSTVTYGTASAPFLATRVLQQMAMDTCDQYPEASEAILNGFYMDDLLSGAENIEAAVQLQRDVQHVLESGGFPLRKWASNSPEVLHGIAAENRALTEEEEASKAISVLGMSWAPGVDQFSLIIESLAVASTKRQLCSVGAKVFDPLGVIGPVTVKLKVLFQKVVESNSGWDDPLPDDIKREFLLIREELDHLKEVKFPRLIPVFNSQVELHGFCAASGECYGTVLYARGVHNGERGQVILLVAKSRVTPRKPVPIERLHLNAALLLSQLLDKVSKALRNYELNVTAWTESSTVMQWLQHHPSEYKCYVANRTQKILDVVSSSMWRCIQAPDNPANCLAQGLSPSELVRHNLWWNGPQWLIQEESQWPERREIPDLLTGEEKPAASHVTQKPIESESLFDRFSSVSQLIRVTTYILRWRNMSTNHERFGRILTVQELENTTLWLIKKVQSECFAEEIKSVVQNQPLKAGSRLSKLVPFLDDSGVLRVKGRIQNSRLEFQTRHPVVLPGDHKFTFQLVQRAHVTHLHAGTSLTQTIMRARYWIVGERRCVKKVIHKCITCFRAKPRLQEPLMGNLPATRVRQARAFLNTGCDFAGPFQVRATKLRKATVTKAYVCLFVCMATKAIHLEAVSDLSTEAFMAALRRFRARRGHCQNLYCDNATNFVGAVDTPDGKGKRLMQHQQRVVKFMSEAGTQFHFIPAYSPTFGGLWERGVGGVKFHLKRVLTDTLLTFEELSTVLTEIEALLNSRPLCPLSSDPDNLDALTPGHFLIGQALVLPPAPDLLAENPNRLNRWRLLQRLSQEFWHRWHTEYITSLQQRPKWTKMTENLCSGDLVLIKTDNLKTGSWALGRVTETHPGSDGVVRVVTLQTPSGLTKRAVNKLAKLPLE